jgi:hypothetical protein
MPEENIAAVTRPWYRRFKPWQFSLRTLLVIMAMVSAVCWYYLLPKKQDEKLANGYLILQRQYRGVINTSNGSAGFNTPLARTDIDDGYWRIKDLEGRLLVNGNYRQDVEHGWWTTYHPNGRKAVQGKMQLGGRVGVWKTWTADGQLVSEVTQALKPPVSPSQSFASDDSSKSMLQGPAKFWHANGKLAAAGSHEKDERTGRWEEWNERGELIAAGGYVAGKKQGAWQEFSAQENKLLTHDYLKGMRKEQLAEDLQRLTERIESSDITQRLTLLVVATDLGQPALPILEKWAANSTSPHVQLAAIRGVAQCGGELAKFESALTEFMKAEDIHLVAAARWELYRHFPNSRPQLLPTLLEEIAQQAEGSPLPAFDKCREMFVLDPPRRATIFAALIACAESEPGLQLYGPGIAPPALAEWQSAAVPFVDEALNDANPKRRRAAVLLIRQLLRERNEFVSDQGRTFLPGKWRIPPTLAPLVARARADHDATVKANADNVDEVYDGSSGAGGGFGGGGGLF